MSETNDRLLDDSELDGVVGGANISPTANMPGYWEITFGHGRGPTGTIAQMDSPWETNNNLPT